MNVYTTNEDSKDVLIAKSFSFFKHPSKRLGLKSHLKKIRGVGRALFTMGRSFGPYYSLSYLETSWPNYECLS